MTSGIFVMIDAEAKSSHQASIGGAEKRLAHASTGDVIGLNPFPMRTFSYERI